MPERGGETVCGLVESNMGLVKYAARRFAGRGMEPEDLIQWGSVGLIKAAKSYDPARGAFSTYAFAMITGQIRTALRDCAPIRAGRRLEEIKRRIDKLEAELMGKGSLRAEELAELLHETKEDVASAMSLSFPLVYLDAPRCEGGGAAAIPDPSCTEEAAVSRVLVEELISKLPEREARLIRLRYFEGATQAAAASRLGLSQPAVSRLEKQALKRLREELLTE